MRETSAGSCRFDSSRQSCRVGKVIYSVADLDFTVVCFLFHALRLVQSNCFGEHSIQNCFLLSNVPPMIKRNFSSFLSGIDKTVFAIFK